MPLSIWSPRGSTPRVRGLTALGVVVRLVNSVLTASSPTVVQRRSAYLTRTRSGNDLYGVSRSGCRRRRRRGELREPDRGRTRVHGEDGHAWLCSTGAFS